MTREPRADEPKRSKMKEYMLDFQSTNIPFSILVENQIKPMLVQ